MLDFPVASGKREVVGYSCQVVLYSCSSSRMANQCQWNNRMSKKK